MIRYVRVACLLALLLGGRSVVAEPTLGAGAAEVIAREEQSSLQLDPPGRALINRDPAVAGDAHLLFFALPNGNTIEQTAGRRMVEGLDWHFDIQHIAAQTRVLRTMMPNTDLRLAYLEAEKLSWPTWRKNHGDEAIPSLFADVAEAAGAGDAPWSLAAHSGGGSLLFGFVNAHETIPDQVERIAWLDANYAFDEEKGHADKLLEWLRRNPAHTLVVVAYDDREITYEGKKVVSDTGGTYRATLERMLPAFESRGVEFEQFDRGVWIQRIAMNGQIDFRVHKNPDNLILHTVLVGEMNGLIYAMTVNTALAEQGGDLAQDRMYTPYVAAE